MVNIGIFAKINSFKQLCQLISLRFKTMKQFVINNVNLIIFHFYSTQNQLNIRCIHKFVLIEFFFYKSSVNVCKDLLGILQLIHKTLPYSRFCNKSVFILNDIYCTWQYCWGLGDQCPAPTNFPCTCIKVSYK